MRILILGGAGLTGPHQIRYALARGHAVTLFNRGKTPLPADLAGVEQLHGDRVAVGGFRAHTPIYPKPGNRFAADPGPPTQKVGPGLH